MSSPIESRDNTVFVELLNEKLDSLPIQNQQDAQIVAAALGALIGANQPPEVPPSLQERITDIRELIDDPLSLEDPSSYPEGVLQQYKQIAIQRIPAKINELLHLTPKEIDDEAKRRSDQSERANAYRQLVQTRRPPTGEAACISEHEWLLQLTREFNEGARLQDADEGSQNDWLAAIRNTLQYASPELLNDRAVVLAAVQLGRRSDA